MGFAAGFAGGHVGRWLWRQMTDMATATGGEHGKGMACPKLFHVFKLVCCIHVFFSNICFHNLSHLSLSDEVDIATPRMQCLELQTSTAVVRRYIGISSTLGVAEVLGPRIA